MYFPLNILLYPLLGVLEGRGEGRLLKIKQLALTNIKIHHTVIIDLS